jgi:GH43 family beta-xylosidase
MRAEIVQFEVEKNEIDWKISQLLISEDNTIILTNGQWNITFFSGTVLVSKHYCTGYYATTWEKNDFSKVTDSLTIKFIP